MIEGWSAPISGPACRVAGGTGRQLWQRLR